MTKLPVGNLIVYVLFMSYYIVRVLFISKYGSHHVKSFFVSSGGWFLIKSVTP